MNIEIKNEGHNSTIKWINYGIIEKTSNIDLKYNISEITQFENLEK